MESEKSVKPARRFFSRDALGGEDRPEFRRDELLLFARQLMIKRQENAFVLGVFALGKGAGRSPGPGRAGRFPMTAHDSRRVAIFRSSMACMTCR